MIFLETRRPSSCRTPSPSLLPSSPNPSLSLSLSGIRRWKQSTAFIHFHRTYYLLFSSFSPGGRNFPKGGERRAVLIEVGAQLCSDRVAPFAPGSAHAKGGKKDTVARHAMGRCERGCETNENPRGSIENGIETALERYNFFGYDEWERRGRAWGEKGSMKII